MCRFLAKCKKRQREGFLDGRGVPPPWTDSERGGNLPQRLGACAVATIRLLVLSGCRRNEILMQRWEEVDLEARELHVRDATGPRAIRPSPAASKLVAGLLRDPGNAWLPESDATSDGAKGAQRGIGGHGQAPEGSVPHCRERTPDRGALLQPGVAARSLDVRHGRADDPLIISRRLSITTIARRLLGQQPEERATPLPALPTPGSPSHSLSFDQRRRPETLRTAMATAFFCPTSTTSRLPRVTPV